MKGKQTFNKALPLVLAAVLTTLCSAFMFMQQDLHQAMDKMMQKMKSMKMTSDPDHDFAMMMVEHHQGSVDMSEIILRSGKDEKIKMMAQNILAKQPAEQTQLRAHAKSDRHDQSQAAHNQTSGSGSRSFSAEMKQAMDGMESSINSMKMMDNPDHDFATMMIPHHQSAIEMSDAILKHGKDQEIKKIAEKIKTDSQKEITELKDWLQGHGK
jgi:uncharacterized protein (DUF305 family)